MGVIPLKEFSDYFFENIANGAQNQLQITSICNAKCIFCSNEQNPFKIKRSNFRSFSELEKVIYATPTINGPIHLNESLPGRMSEGEAFLHPKFFDILKLIRSKFTNTISISTNGALLTKELVEQLKHYNPMQIAISIPTIDKEYWKETFRMDDLSYTTAMNSFDLLDSNRIAASANLVPMPAWIGWDNIEKTIEFISRRVAHILVYAPGYTKESKIKDKLVYDKMELSLFLERMSKKYTVIYYWHLDPRKPLYVNYDLLTKNISFAVTQKYKNLLWLTSTAAKEKFTDILASVVLGFPINHSVLEVNNKVYGGNIECSGLWLIQDIYDALDDYLSKNPVPDQIFMPKGFIDRYGFDLQGNNIIDLFKKYPHITIGLL